MMITRSHVMHLLSPNPTELDAVSKGFLLETLRKTTALREVFLLFSRISRFHVIFSKESAVGMENPTTPQKKSGGFASPTWNGIASFSSQTKTTWWLNQNKLGKYDRQNSKWESSPGNDKTNWQLKCGDNCGRFWVDHFVGEGLFDDEQAGKYRGMSEIYLI